MNEQSNSVPTLEILPPDITPYREGNTGIPYVTTYESGEPGPHVVINALTHGNELCGAYALDYLFKAGVRPVKGRLTLSFANVAAFDRFDPADPFASRYVDEDFNRLWTNEVLGSSRGSIELTRARELAPLIRKADWLLDIHSMHLASPPLLMCGMQDKSIRLGLAMGYPANMVRDWGHAAGRRMRDFGGFDDPADPKLALLIECGQHWERSSVDVAIETTLRFLRESGVVDPAFTGEHLKVAEPAAQRLIDVQGPITIKSNRFRFLQNFQGLEVIPNADTLIGYDGEDEVRTPFEDCVLIMPGRQLSPGLSAVRLGRYADLEKIAAAS